MFDRTETRGPTARLAQEFADLTAEEARAWARVEGLDEEGTVRWMIETVRWMLARLPLLDERFAALRHARVAQFEREFGSLPRRLRHGPLLPLSPEAARHVASLFRQLSDAARDATRQLEREAAVSGHPTPTITPRSTGGTR